MTAHPAASVPSAGEPILTPPYAADRPAGRAKHAEDTVAGCRLRSLADHDRADATATDNARRKYQLSAANWAARGDMLEQVAAAYAARQAVIRTAALSQRPALSAPHAA